MKARREALERKRLERIERKRTAAASAQPPPTAAQKAAAKVDEKRKRERSEAERKLGARAMARGVVQTSQLGFLAFGRRGFTLPEAKALVETWTPVFYEVLDIHPGVVAAVATLPLLTAAAMPGGAAEAEEPQPLRPAGIEEISRL